MATVKAKETPVKKQVYIYCRDAHDRRACKFIYLPAGSTVKDLAQAAQWVDRQVKVNVDEETAEFKLVPFLEGSLVSIAGKMGAQPERYDVDLDTELKDQDRVTFAETWDPRPPVTIKTKKASKT